MGGYYSMLYLEERNSRHPTGSRTARIRPRRGSSAPICSFRSASRPATSR
jgi:hypothetical protein